MIFFVAIVSGFFKIISMLLTVYTYIVIARCLISWVNPDPYNSIVRFLYTVTEPLLWRIRKFLPFTYMNGFDLSPVALIIVVYFIQHLVEMFAMAVLMFLASSAPLL